ncbi:biotin--[acetyl-CoA-carboxylase] ligase [Mesonia sp. HuA40]|uniref:biotin--[acetyl-CoA-carboxylase] ligase n=1 Tax=Mesonia sp. HuA40 TaxID=2602761 RepID=UPI0011C8BCCD|nr:biotin--[acetyl-CoA-carboxylase] ligase [Mesonia sp. HuA40]TXK71191.1 biotin--[acetyl-CoA-carboxylase] ligase [Mesonia sp. HuA40]
MQIIKVHTTPSTNTYLKEFYRAYKQDDPVLVSCRNQTQGRGQLGAKWESIAHKNLAFSLLMPNLNLPIKDSFKISMVAAIAIHSVLQEVVNANWKIKWPNDILADSKKIAGILIENIIVGKQIKGSVIGVGVNVNQSDFGDLPKASSLCLLKHKLFNLDVLETKLANHLKNEMEKSLNESFDLLSAKYHQTLFKRNEVAVFEFPDGEKTTGIIKSVSPEGLLQVLLEDARIREFNLKEVKLLY